MADTSKTCPPHKTYVDRIITRNGVKYKVIRCTKCGTEKYVKA